MNIDKVEIVSVLGASYSLEKKSG